MRHHFGDLLDRDGTYWTIVPNREHLPVDVIKSNHPEVSVWHDGRRMIGDPASTWFEFTGKSAGRVKCGSASAEAKCRAYSERYDDMKKEARAWTEGRSR